MNKVIYAGWDILPFSEMYLYFFLCMYNVWVKFRLGPCGVCFCLFHGQFAIKKTSLSKTSRFLSVGNLRCQ